MSRIEELREALIAEVHLKALSGTTLEPVKVLVSATQDHLQCLEGALRVWWCEERQVATPSVQACPTPAGASELHAKCGVKSLIDR